MLSCDLARAEYEKFNLPSLVAAVEPILKFQANPSQAHPGRGYWYKYLGLPDVLHVFMHDGNGVDLVAFK